MSFGYQLGPGEEVLVEAGANLFRGAEGVGGRMRVTNRRLIFEPHALNLQTQPEEISIRDIAEVGERNTFGFIRNGMFVRTKASLEYKFVVQGRDELISVVRELVASGGSTTPTNQPAGDLVSELDKLAKLHDRGILTEEEFKRAKALLLGK